MIKAILSPRKILATNRFYTKTLNELRDSLNQQLEMYEQNSPRSDYSYQAKEFYVNQGYIIRQTLKKAREIKKGLKEGGLERVMRLVGMPLPEEIDGFISTYQKKLADCKYHFRVCKQFKSFLGGYSQKC
jgi:hypothetical protein